MTPLFLKYSQRTYEAPEAGAAGVVPDPGTAPLAPPPGTISVAVFQSRVDELTAARHAESRRADSLQQELVRTQAKLQQVGTAAAGADPAAAAAATLQSQELIDAAIEQQANAKAVQIADQKEFDNRCNTAYADGIKTFGEEFKTSVATLNSLGVLDKPFLEAALETGASAKIITELAKNTTLAVELAKMTPVKKALALSKLATAELSKAPPPIGAVVNGSGGLPGAALADPNSSTKDWMAARNAELAAKRKR